MPRTAPALPPRSAALGAAALALALTGCQLDSSPARAVVVERPAAVASPSASPSASTVAPTAAPTDAPTQAPAARPTAPATAEPTSPATVPVVQPTVPAASPTAPAASPPAAAPAAPARPVVDVAAVQRRLADLHYYARVVDGRSGPATRSAVMAFQKVNGLSADGTVGPRTLAALASPRTPVLRASSPADRVEVDLDRQVLYVVEDGRIARIMPVSSGNGERYRQKDGGRARALTPVGTYRIERRIEGVREADLGTLYDPQYFYRGWAIHGSNSVPAGPASHGCVRVTRADARALLRLIDVGTTVHLYGGTHVFRAGSGAAGTSTPAGDGGQAPAPR